MGKLKDMFKKFIEKLGNENEKTYGGKKLDCCDLNKQKPKNK